MRCRNTAMGPLNPAGDKKRRRIKCTHAPGMAVDNVGLSTGPFLPRSSRTGRQGRLIILGELKVKQLTVLIAVRAYHPRSQTEMRK
jgi:hypothetical protein